MLFRDKILSKTVDECIDSDLYWYGESYIRSVYRRMTSVSSLNKEYKIYFDRSESKYGYNYDYICHMMFYNNLNIELLHLKFTEICAFRLVNTLYEYFKFHDTEINIPLDSVDTDLSDYLISVKKDPDKDMYTFIINKYSRILNKLNPSIILYLDSDIFTNLIYLMYFSYLIDIDNRDIVENSM